MTYQTYPERIAEVLTSTGVEGIAVHHAEAFMVLEAAEAVAVGGPVEAEALAESYGLTA